MPAAEGGRHHRMGHADGRFDLVRIGGSQSAEQSGDHESPSKKSHTPRHEETG